MLPSGNAGGRSSGLKYGCRQTSDCWPADVRHRYGIAGRADDAECHPVHWRWCLQSESGVMIPVCLDLSQPAFVILRKKVTALSAPKSKSLLFVGSSLPKKHDRQNFHGQQCQVLQLTE